MKDITDADLLALLRQGYSYAQIGARYGTTAQAIRGRCRRRGLAELARADGGPAPAVTHRPVLEAAPPVAAADAAADLPADDDGLAVGGSAARLVVERARREAREANRDLRAVAAERDELAAELGLYRSLDGLRADPPHWVREKGTGAGHHGMVSVVLSDPHFDEVVKPEQVAWYNAYNRRIGELRLHSFFEKAVELPRDYMAGVTYDGIVLHMTGDTFSGDIHDELVRTNEATILESLLYWLEPVEAGINMLAEEYGRVLIPCVPGNHPRMTKKPVAKDRAQTNMEWLFYSLLARDYRNDDRVTVIASGAADLMVPIYGTRFLQTHGDQFRGGNGIAGMLSPLMLGQHRKTRRQIAAGEPYDWMLMGHWHSYWHGKGIIVSGALKGMDEYAWIGNFEPEPPRLAGFITTPERGVTISFPIEPMDRAAEGW